MTVRSTFAALIAVTGMLLTGCAGQAAPASSSDTPSPSPDPVAAVDLAAGELTGPLAVAVDDPEVAVTFREITLQPGAGTGRHCHDGQLIAVVAAGELTHYAPNHPDGVAVYATGEAIVEGPGYIHEGRNEGDEPVVLWVTYLIPEGDPLAETDLARCDP